MAMDTTNKEGSLAVLVLLVCVDATANKKFDDRLTVWTTSEMQRSGEVGIRKVWLGPGALNQKHQHLGETQLGGFMEHWLAELVVNITFLDVV